MSEEEIKNLIEETKEELRQEIEDEIKQHKHLGTDSQKIDLNNSALFAPQDTVEDPQDATSSYSQTQMQDVVDTINELIDKLQKLGLIR